MKVAAPLQLLVGLYCLFVMSATTTSAEVQPLLDGHGISLHHTVDAPRRNLEEECEPTPKGYTFVQGQSPSYQLGKIAIDSIVGSLEFVAKKCTKMCDCKAFNDQGWLFKDTKPLEPDYPKLAAKDACMGYYIKSPKLSCTLRPPRPSLKPPKPTKSRPPQSPPASPSAPPTPSPSVVITSPSPSSLPPPTISAFPPPPSVELTPPPRDTPPTPVLAGNFYGYYSPNVDNVFVILYGRLDGRFGLVCADDLASTVTTVLPVAVQNTSSPLRSCSLATPEQQALYASQYVALNTSIPGITSTYIANRLACQGTESRVSLCPANWGVTSCQSYAVALWCERGDVNGPRLALPTPPPPPLKGSYFSYFPPTSQYVLSILYGQYDGVYGLVCADGLTGTTPQVVPVALRNSTTRFKWCSLATQEQIDSGAQQMVDLEASIPGISNTYIATNLACLGTESRLGECPVVWGRTSCASGGVKLWCERDFSTVPSALPPPSPQTSSPQTPALGTKGSYFSYFPPTAQFVRVIFYARYDGILGLVCADGLTSTTPQVVPVALRNSTTRFKWCTIATQEQIDSNAQQAIDLETSIPGISNTFVATNLACLGTESRVGECSVTWGRTGCLSGGVNFWCERDFDQVPTLSLPPPQPQAPPTTGAYFSYFPPTLQFVRVIFYAQYDGVNGLVCADGLTSTTPQVLPVALRNSATRFKWCAIATQEQIDSNAQQAIDLENSIPGISNTFIATNLACLGTESRVGECPVVWGRTGCLSGGVNFWCERDFTDTLSSPPPQPQLPPTTGSYFSYFPPTPQFVRVIFYAIYDGVPGLVCADGLTTTTPQVLPVALRNSATRFKWCTVATQEQVDSTIQQMVDLESSIPGISNTFIATNLACLGIESKVGECPVVWGRTGCLSGGVNFWCERDFDLA